MGVIASVDTGGTFTDGYFTRDGRTARVKVETTPHDFTECFIDCLEAGATELGYADLQAMLFDTDILRFASTIATNAMIEHKGPRIGLLVSAGHRDDLYGDGELLYGHLLDRDLVVEYDVDEGEDVARNQLRSLLQAGARVLVVSLTGSDADAAAEREVKTRYERAYPRHYLGAVSCLPASEVTRRPNDARRTNTAVVNAYLHPELVRTLYKADEDVRSRGYPRPLLIVHGSGGVARVAKTRAIEQYNCGPAGGVYGAATMVERYELPAALTMDMGGTSTDYSYVRSDRVPFDLDPHIEGIPVWTPLVEVGTFGCGGSSVISTGEEGLLVGPESMGSAPGPACYGLGGTSPTPTDAHLVLGTLDPDNYLGGRRRLDPGRARDALTTLGDAPAEEMARRVHRACVATIVDHLKRALAQVGAAPEQTALLAFGGAGGLFGADVARTLGLARVYSFADAAVFSAFGVSGMDVAHLYDLQLGQSASELRDELDTLRARAELDMSGEGLAPERIAYRLEAETDDGLVAIDATPTNWESGLSKALELSPQWLRLRASVEVPRPDLRPGPDGDPSPDPARTGARPIHLTRDDGDAEADIFDRSLLRPGMRVDGPAVVEAKDTTTLVPAGATLTVDGYHSGIIEFGG